MAPEYDIPVLENEEMWSQRVIDEEQRRQRERNEIVTKIDTWQTFRFVLVYQNSNWRSYNG